MYTCKACAERGKPWAGDNPRCGFTGPNQSFVPDNWSCATLDRLRELVYEGQVSLPAGVDYQYCDDQKYATVNIDTVTLEDERIGLALWVSWYKSRGTTDAVWVLDNDRPPRPPTEAEVLAIVAHFEQRAAATKSRSS